MSRQPLSIVQIGTTEVGGGAAMVASSLMRGFQSRGHRVCHVVGRKQTRDADVVWLADDDRRALRLTGYGIVQASLHRLARRFPGRGFGLASRGLRLATHPRALACWRAGVEDFEFPGSRQVFARLDSAPDIVHGHNLHGGYFDLRALSDISRRVPTVLTLHDMWLLTGHCAHSLECARWKTGCGACPDLSLSPPIRRDATAQNWRRKRHIFKQSRLHVVTPSAWLRDKVAESMLAPHAVSVRVIPNGVDTAMFYPGSREAARRTLGLPSDRFVVLLTAGSGGGMWNDDRMLYDAIGRLVARDDRAIEFVAVGRERSFSSNAPARIRSLPFEPNAAKMADIYRSADLYLHAVRADTSPLAILEAMACGTPVVASAVGGIPEQVHTADVRAVPSPSVGLGGATGVLVRPAAGAEMAEAADALLSSRAVRSAMGENGVRRIVSCFTIERQVEAYLQVYEALLDGTLPGRMAPSPALA